MGLSREMHTHIALNIYPHSLTWCVLNAEKEPPEPTKTNNPQNQQISESSTPEPRPRGDLQKPHHIGNDEEDTDDDSIILANCPLAQLGMLHPKTASQLR